jgi:hypothetical protein
MQLRDKKADYRVEPNGSFVIENYNEAKPFSNFLPGVAGPFGIPLWAFYVNRGQGIASFGVSDKDHAIVQFYPANRSYEMTSLRGFRTFLKVTQRKETHYYEPFQSNLPHSKFDTTQSMRVQSHGFGIEESNHSLGLDVKVSYFGIPGEPFAGLARKVVIQNKLAVPQELEIADGLPVVVPYGLKEWFLKDMSRTVEAWMKCEILTGKDPVAHFKLKSDPEDRPEYQAVDGTHFYTSFAENSSPKTRGKSIAPVIVADPEALFGARLDFSEPQEFMSRTPYAPESQVLENKTPCAFSVYHAHLEPEETFTIYTLIGEAAEGGKFAKDLPRLRDSKYFAAKEREAREVIHRLQDPITTVSGSTAFDDYCRQTFLDNGLRGGFPHRMTGPSGDFVFHIYSRKHGDLERDYNRFVVQPTYFSQGEGNFRDVNQNRRSDVWFEPKVKDLNVRTFFNLIQPDGYNPLVVEQLVLTLTSSRGFRKAVGKLLTAAQTAELETYLDKPRTPGEIAKRIEAYAAAGKSREALLSAVFGSLERLDTARHGEGFWIDHWTYNLDLLESYLSVYPDELENALWRDASYTYFESDHIVQPRALKYFKLPDGRIRQYRACVRDAEKAAMIAARAAEPHKVRVKHGKGKVAKSTLAAKMLIVITNKFASLDPFGAGVEMESDKPDWYDALNGLPGLLGSSLSETYELLRWVRFLENAIGRSKLRASEARVAVPAELAELIKKCDLLARKALASKAPSKHQEFWDATHTTKEKYWAATRLGFAGREVKLPLPVLKKTLAVFAAKIEEGIGRAYDASKETCPTYFENEIVDYKAIPGKKGGRETIVPRKFRQRRLAIFLEGPMHALRVEKDPVRARQVYEHVRSSTLFDRKLSMYTVTSSLENESPEIGRARVFSPGWLENQSVFLHMEYKWLLETLKRGLHNEFFNDMQSALVPFQDPKVYGRSIFENSSFIASSAFSNRKLHGTGFVARLSGSTAEFLDMWLRMNLGHEPFGLDAKGQLEFAFNPILPDWMFTKEEVTRRVQLRDGSAITVTLPKNAYAFVLMGQTLVVYTNPKRLNTYGPRRAAVKRVGFMDANKKQTIIDGNTLSAPHAKALRDGLIRRVDVELS